MALALSTWLGPQSMLPCANCTALQSGSWSGKQITLSLPQPPPQAFKTPSDSSMSAFATN